MTKDQIENLAKNLVDFIAPEVFYRGIENDDYWAVIFDDGKVGMIPSVWMKRWERWDKIFDMSFSVAEYGCVTIVEYCKDEKTVWVEKTKILKTPRRRINNADVPF